MGSRSVVVIGAGPGGEAAAKRVAERGAQVTLVEQGELGGLCLNRGCVPSKVLLEGGRLLRQVRQASFLGDVARPTVDWGKLQERKRAVVDQLRNALDQRLAQLRVNVVKGQARFVSERVLEVTGPEGVRGFSFDAAVIATGSRPFYPPPFDGLVDQVFNSDQILSLTEVPKSLAVVGGGAVGLEFACLFREWGASVTVIEKMPQLLPGEEAAVSRILQKSFEKRGMTVRTDRVVETAEKTPEGWRLTLSDGETVRVEQVLVSVGRRPSGAELGLEAARVFHEGGRIAVNQFMQTTQNSLYAVGDVNGLSLLAHAASVQGKVAAGHLMGESTPYDPARVPRCLYTWPEVASVGEWTHSASVKDLDVRAQRFFFQGSPKALATGETEGLIQILSNKKTGRILGAQIVGPHATELIHVFSVALNAGQTVDQLRQVVFAHPTLSEGIGEALWR